MYLHIVKSQPNLAPKIYALRSLKGIKKRSLTSSAAFFCWSSDGSYVNCYFGEVPDRVWRNRLVLSIGLRLVELRRSPRDRSLSRLFLAVLSWRFRMDCLMRLVAVVVVLFLVRSDMVCLRYLFNCVFV